MKHFLKIQGFPEFFALVGWTCALIMDVVNAVFNQLKKAVAKNTREVASHRFLRYNYEN